MSSLRVLNNVVDRLGHAPKHISVFVNPRCENLTKCLQGVNSLTNTIVCVNTIVEIITPSLFGNLTTCIKG